MTIFDYIGDVFVHKKGNLPLDEYVPFLINRWLSFSTTSAVNAINDTVNSYSSLDKETHYKLLIALLPKVKYTPKINYIKKIKKPIEEKDDKIERLSKSWELSQKEVRQMLELQQQLG